jgi:exodeoxyribonuclease (lambda-induced)
MKYYWDIVQGSEEWHDLKIGKFSGTSCNDLLMDKKNKGYQNLIYRIFEEQFTSEPCELEKPFNGNAYTERGLKYESLAIQNCEKENLIEIKSVGFVELDNWVGCSPDGLINDIGLVQIKCPIFKTQLNYLEIDQYSMSNEDKLRKINKVYYNQMQFELMVTDREYNIFYSYHPKLKPVELIIERDERLIEQIKIEIEIAKETITKQIEELRKLNES